MRKLIINIENLTKNFGQKVVLKKTQFKNL